MKTGEATGNGRQHREISRLLTAAVISSSFRKMLLNNPEQALTSGFKGEAFHLAKEEKRRLAAIQATSLADFASQLPPL